jgi:peptidoglycan/LPS O-acetylase OafA/YrhL
MRNDGGAHLIAERLSARHLPCLDGVRGIAILWVALFHFLPNSHREPGWANVLFEFTGTGWLGVDLFFVLSGFLITRILVQTRDEPRRFRNFYARRCLRIFPLYYGVLLTVFAAVWLNPAFDTPSFRENIAAHQAWLWLYGTNWFLWLQGDWVLSSDWFEANHFWSLAVEEQFYLVWPLLVWRLPRRALAPVLAGLIVCFAGIRLANAVWDIDLPHFRMDGLFVGALLYLVLADGRLRPVIGQWAMRLFPAGVVFFVVLTLWRDHGLRPEDRLVSSVGISVLLAVMACGIAAALAAPETSWGYRALNARVLTAFGKYSYGIYVYHVLFRPFIQEELINGSTMPAPLNTSIAGHFAACAVLLAGSFAAAWLSYHVYEKRFLELKRLFV